MNNKKYDLTGRSLGFLLILVGSTMLCMAFLIAYNLYSSPLPSQLVPNKAIPVNINEFIPSTVNLFYDLIYKSGLLIIMGLIGGILTNRGINLFIKSASKQNIEL